MMYIRYIFGQTQIQFKEGDHSFYAHISEFTLLLMNSSELISFSFYKGMLNCTFCISKCMKLKNIYFKKT